MGAGSDGTEATGDTPDRNLLARYGEDMVLRFNISNAEEASALAEASDILFLDVWEFNEDWVDIRIAKDVVSPSTFVSYPALVLRER